MQRRPATRNASDIAGLACHHDDPGIGSERRHQTTRAVISTRKVTSPGTGRRWPQRARHRGDGWKCGRRSRHGAKSFERYPVRASRVSRCTGKSSSGRKGIQNDQVIAIGRRFQRQARIANHDGASVAPLDRNVKRRGSRAMRITSGSISKNVQNSPALRWQASVPVPSPTTAT